ncbi:hypothetical protein A5819_003792 [Enterococcus sp. 7E2_DIV0204]|nr:hypothetical protein A5819_003792 [Enterococcus sp. 7E2_DIV0204]OTP53078.1 hypothetical protein A5884_002281 [Enterococcus sp. 7D2_DIV0200]
MSDQNLSKSISEFISRVAIGTRMDLFIEYLAKQLNKL